MNCRLHVLAGAGYSRTSADEKYPAPGFRDPASGTLYYIGQYGYSFSSAVVAADAYAYFLSFYSGGLTPQGSYYRASARQVRCLLE